MAEIFRLTAYKRKSEKISNSQDDNNDEKGICLAPGSVRGVLAVV